MDLYREQILDHYRNPRNNKKPDKSDLYGGEVNHLCGDSVEVFIVFDKDKKVKEAYFQGSGCAISQASASMFTEKLIGKSLSELSKITEKEMLEFFNGQIVPGRLRCALLPLTALRNGLTNNGKTS